MNRLFVYGIFLGERQRQAYGMTNPHYATVFGYATYGGQIVMAYPAMERNGTQASLTGLIVDVDPTAWDSLDDLEYGYERIVITTTSGEQAYMYAGRDFNARATVGGYQVAEA